MQTRLLPVAAITMLLLAACAGAPALHVPPQAPPVTLHAPAPPRLASRPQATCRDCGRVLRIEVVSAIRATASGGAVLAGVVGGVLSAPTPPARAGAAGAGSGVIPAASAATPRPAQRAWRVQLRMDDGRALVVHQNLLSREIVAGSRVRLVQGRLVPLH